MLFTEEKLITSQLKVSIGIDAREFVIQIRTVNSFEGRMSIGTSAVFKKLVPGEQHSRAMLFLLTSLSLNAVVYWDLNRRLERTRTFSVRGLKKSIMGSQFIA